MNTPIPLTPSETVKPGIDEIFEPLELLMRRPSGDGDKGLSDLQISMHFIQVYSKWGLNLPTEDLEFTKMLNGKGIADVIFVKHLRDANIIISETCSTFRSKTLVGMVTVNSLMGMFAEHMTDVGGRFELLLSRIKGNKKDRKIAAKLLMGLIKNAQDAYEKSGEVADQLIAFRTELEKAGGKLAAANKAVSEDEGYNDAAIDKLAGDEDTAGSIKEYMKLLNTSQSEYEEAVKIASTTPAYAWVNVPLPFGLIAASIVAGIYGDKARNLVKKIAELQILLEARETELRDKLKLRGTMTIAHKACENVSKYTDMAAAHTTQVMNAWKGVVDLLTRIKDDIEMTMDGNSPEVYELAELMLLSVRENFEKLQPTLKELNDKPYITVVEGEVSNEDFGSSVVEHVNAQKAS